MVPLVRFGNLGTVSYSHSIGLRPYLVSLPRYGETLVAIRDFFFYTALALDDPLRGICHKVWYGKTKL